MMPATTSAGLGTRLPAHAIVDLPDEPLQAIVGGEQCARVIAAAPDGDSDERAHRSAEVGQEWCERAVRVCQEANRDREAAAVERLGQAACAGVGHRRLVPASAA
jgi:hypothetical protein